MQNAPGVQGFPLPSLRVLCIEASRTRGHNFNADLHQSGGPASLGTGTRVEPLLKDIFAIRAKSAEHGRVGGREPHPIDQMVGARLRLRRMQKGLSQSALAHSVGVTFQAVQKYESGDIRISGAGSTKSRVSSRPTSASSSVTRPARTARSPSRAAAYCSSSAPSRRSKTRSCRRTCCASSRASPA
jgi:DNA-binding transcriptional regulator YiaG